MLPRLVSNSWSFCHSLPRIFHQSDPVLSSGSASSLCRRTRWYVARPEVQSTMRSGQHHFHEMPAGVHLPGSKLIPALGTVSLPRIWTDFSEVALLLASSNCWAAAGRAGAQLCRKESASGWVPPAFILSSLHRTRLTEGIYGADYQYKGTDVKV